MNLIFPGCKYSWTNSLHIYSLHPDATLGKISPKLTAQCLTKWPFLTEQQTEQRTGTQRSSQCETISMRLRHPQKIQRQQFICHSTGHCSACLIFLFKNHNSQNTCMYIKRLKNMFSWQQHTLMITLKASHCTINSTSTGRD